jgi:hypothetical protein
VLEARPYNRDQGLEQLCVLGDFLQEAKGGTADVLVGVLLDQK